MQARIRLISPRRRKPAGAAPIAVLGPTNTGKTHYAIERMLARQSGMIGLPLRLLAREVYDRVVAARGAGSAALVTGEEKIVPAEPRYWICTVEAMPEDRDVAFVAIDEVQLAADMERGRVFTSRLLNARGREETLFLGSDTMRPILRRMFPEISFLSRDRLSVLSYSGQKKVTRLPRRSAVVGFSSDTVYAVAELIRRQRGGAAVILGALSPRTRNAQAELYQSGEVDYLVATDAIGMGLNMDIDHVAFSARRKFDGRIARDLKNDELAQIAGRAGRHMRDGTFGVTADCPVFDDETIAAIEDHRFEPVRALQWRSDDLHFASIGALMRSLSATPSRVGLQRARPGEDELALARLAVDDEISAMKPRGASLQLLWEVCQTPDFRKTSIDHHARLLGEIYRQLAQDGRISADWLAPRVNRLDRTDGDIDAISSRISNIRTWTYLSHRAEWLGDAPYWQEKARAIEDSLSDALHEKLTQRFVDRRTSVLLKRLKDEAPLLAGVTEDGEVIVEGHFIGRLLGFEFIVDPRASGNDAKRVRAAAERALAPELAARAALLANARSEELALRSDGVVTWRSAPVAQLEKGPAPLRPNLAIRGAENFSPNLRGRIYERVQSYVGARIEALLSELIALAGAVNAGDGGELAALTRGVAFRLVENFGAMSRAQFGDELKQLDQSERAKLRSLGVRFGEYTLFMPKLLKPAPARLLTLLWALWTDRSPVDFEPPKAGLVSVPCDKDLPHAYYYAAGYRPSGARAVRIDMMERLAGQIRADRKGGAWRGGFEASQQMMSLVGCSGEEFESILTSLGYRKSTIEVSAPPPESQSGEGAQSAQSDKPNTQSVGSPAAPHSSENAATQDIGDNEASPEAAAETASPAPSPGEGLSAPAGAAPSAEGDGAQPNPDPPPTPANDIDAPNESNEAASPALDASQPAVREVVIWRQAPRRPPKKKQQTPRKDDKRGKPQGRKRRDGDGRPSKGGSARPQMLHAPHHRKVADPNSPFAILAGLKDDLANSESAPKEPEKNESAR